MNTKFKAFLSTISTSEGTYGVGDRGYNVLVGSTSAHPLLFQRYADHPRVFNKQMDSTAAGRYQELEKNFDFYRIKLGLNDFSPASQDAIALEQLRECQALDFIAGDRFEDAVVRCCHIWASFPGAGYGQHENSMEKLRGIYDFYMTQDGGQGSGT